MSEDDRKRLRHLDNWQGNEIARILAIIRKGELDGVYKRLVRLDEINGYERFPELDKAWGKYTKLYQKFCPPETWRR